ncbi:MAG: hypothetical protein K0S23_2362 [Fluviicola sp.]|jgi:hypothetical protein|uniref:hypothetical protein n=1 Tax=Fluviicola sp. TaxID=1917219 RepID=UPI002624D352|nr:hypothetical protein [Fluviicola sp.]MDF3028055.1 hypothetical protein [Fluviicola sp.]
MDTTDSPVLTPPVQLPKKRKRRWLRISYSVLIHGLATIALGLIGVAVAVKMKWTNDGGNVDLNSRYFSQMAGKYNQGFQTDSLTFAKQERLMYQNVGLLAKYYPHNAKIILDAFQRTGDVTIALRMLDAANLRMKNHKGYQKELQRIEKQADEASLSVYPWANYREWKEFCSVVRADSAAIDSVSRITGVESRLIVMCLVGEQIRMFNSSREQFKKYVVPYNRLILTTNRGYGVTGILQNTALKIERNLYEKGSPFYPGDYYQNCLNVKDSFPELVNDTIEAHKHLTIQRLMKGGDHFYSYLYTAFFLRQFQAHWEREGFTLAYRPEILGTLYNLGFQKSKPKKNPSVGGSTFKVGDKEYTFGGLCYEFYYSGELMDLFPLTSKPFIPTRELERTIVFPEKEEEIIPPVAG